MKSPGSSDAIPHAVLVAALQEFTAKGYADARLDAIAAASGVSKRMLHYHCGDKMGLYRATWAHVLETVRPDDDDLRPHSNVPVEALQHVVGVIYDYFSANPLAVRFIIQENLHPVLPLEGVTGLGGQSPIVLEFDRILLLGRDYGAFRTDISALDLYILVLSLATFPTLHQRTFENLYGIEMQSTVLSDKLREFAQDTVTSLLTSSPRNEPGSSYTSLLASHGVTSSALGAEVYGDQPNPETQDLAADDAPDYRDIYGMDD
ncbi:TetR/AcrR family transcriptional regulator [Corynebacterium vitaeruminis]|uniref:TetR/AcrR family transcriptional regulator n=1 Tax=Corynebacterium vitaeruminis TaxID=38305 RepID=UPI00065FD4E6|nr:TetR/AcrR family transcriptional regulator [Corynebacterium vitaeruminis]